jgi:phage FluMu gp28-like protein
MGSGKGGLWTPEERLNFADSFIMVDQKPIELDFWQQDHIRDTNKYSIILKGRRTGFSFDVALKGIIKSQDKSRFKYTRQFVSYNFDDAKEKINYAKEFYHSIPKKHRKALVSETKTTMEFLDKGGKTTSRLISIACRPPRGRGGDIVFDEMAIYPRTKARTIYTAGLPVVSRGGCVEIGSTPLGKIGLFYELYTEKETYPEYQRFEVPWWYVGELCNNVAEAVKLAPYMDTENRVELFGTVAIKTQLKSMALEDFQQEYECSFIDSALSYITLDLIDANTPGMREGDRVGFAPEDGEEEDIEVKIFKDADSLIVGYSSFFEKYSNGEPIRLYMGYDVARYRDAAVIFVIGHLPNGKKISVAEIEMKVKEYEFQLDQFRKVFKQLPAVRACIDRTGIGDPLCETLQKEFGTAKVEGVQFVPAAKEDLAIGVKTGLEKKEFLLQNDSKFRRQIHSIKRIAVSGGSFRYDSERDEDGHADTFWAWALANKAVINGGEKQGNFYTQYAGKKQAGVVQSEKDTKNASPSKPAPTLTGRRGRSISSVLRGVERANR